MRFGEGNKQVGDLRTGRKMPFIQIYMLEGRSDEVKKTLIEKVTDACVDAGCGPADHVRIMIQDVPKSQWGIAGKTAKELGR
jgi:4-oxalocrotonate tautomerase